MISAICFGSAVLPSQWATSAGLSAAAVVAARFFVATLAVAPSAPRAIGSREPAGHQTGKQVDVASRPAAKPGTYVLAWLISGGVNTAGFLMLTEALQRTTAATAAFLAGLGVLIVPLLVALVTGRLPRAARCAAVALAVVGSLVLTGGSVSLGAGPLLALGAALVGALHILSVGYFSVRLDVPLYNTGQLAVVLVGAAVITASTGGPGVVTPAGLAAAAWCGLAQAAGLTLQAWGQRGVDGSTAALIFTLVPVVALLSAWALDGQNPSAAELVGGALLVLAVIVGERVGERTRTGRGEPAVDGTGPVPAVAPSP